MKKLLAFAMSLALLLTLAAQPLTGRAEGAPRPLANFNGDAYADLAIGVAYEDVIATDDNAGAINVLYGASSSGLDDANDQLWYQGNNGLVNYAEEDDAFGYSLVVGDFDGDGYTDLAVGVPYEDNGTATTDSGAVHIVYGTAAGLSSTDDKWIDQNSSGILDDDEDIDKFGYTLTVGDFNGDSYDDLAVGVPEEDVNGLANAGAVNVLYGSATGLGGDNSFWHQDTTNVEGVAEANDYFGRSLTAGDFDGDGYSDLAVGVPYEAVGSASDAGAVNILYGSASGLTASGDQIWDQDSSDVSEGAEADDVFGYDLTAGDFDGDGYTDLAVGVPGEDMDLGSGLINNMGVTQVLYGSAAGITAADDDLWHQSSAGIEEVAEEGDYFGYVLTAGDLDGDGYADLAVAAPFEDLGSATAAGGVNVLYGSGNGLDSNGDQFWSQDVLGVADWAETDDKFGYALAAGDFDGDSFDDLAVGVPYEDFSSISGAGMVHILSGSATGIALPGGDQAWTQDTGDVNGVAEEGDLFGCALAALFIPDKQLVYLPLIIR